MENALRQLKTQLESWPQWQAASSAVLAISGGVDSMCLLHLMLELFQLQEYQDRQLIVAHFNHQLRSQQIHAIEQELVIQTAQAHDLVYFVSKWQQPQTTNREASARIARYQFLADVVHATQADCLMTAHHLDDAVETFMMRLIRGSSLKGLNSIDPNYQRQLLATNGQVVITQMMRPLINFRKSELYQYASSHHISYYEDETNQHEEVFRNRIRHRYLPELEDENPQFYLNARNFQQQLQVSYQAHYQNFMAIEPNLLAKFRDPGWVLDVRAWQQLSPEQLQIYLGIFFEERYVEVAGQYDKDILSLVSQQLTHQDNPNYTLRLSNDWISRREYDFIYIELRDYEKFVSEQVINLVIHNKWHSLGNGWWIGIFDRNFVSNQMRQAVDEYMALDLTAYDQVPLFSVRHRLPGDSMTLGNQDQAFHKKVSRILIDAKVPASQRETMWLVVDEEDDTVWLIGQQKSIKYQPHEPESISHYLLIQKMY